LQKDGTCSYAQYTSHKHSETTVPPTDTIYDLQFYKDNPAFSFYEYLK